jgi:hypothetical protein
MTPHVRAKRDGGQGPPWDRWRALAIAIVLLAPGLAGANDQAPPPPPPPPPYSPAPAPVPAPAPAPAPYQPPPYQPPGAAPPAGARPGYGPPIYAPQPSGAPVYAPEEISDFDDSAPVPYGYTKVSRARKGLIVAGAVTLGATYLATTFVAAVADDINKADGSNVDVTPLYVPVVGPYLEIGNTDSSVARFYLTVSGLGQTAGAIMLVYGLTSPRTVLVRNDQLIVTSIAPLIAPGASGLSVVGRF